MLEKWMCQLMPSKGGLALHRIARSHGIVHGIKLHRQAARLGCGQGGLTCIGDPFGTGGAIIGPPPPYMGPGGGP